MQEIESQALIAQQQIGLARTQMTGKQREQRLLRLTISEMAALPSDVVVYEGVGKMYVDSQCFSHARLFGSCCHRQSSSCIFPSFRLPHHHTRSDDIPSPTHAPKCLTLNSAICRFVSLPVDSLRKKLEGQTQAIETEVDKLSKRLLYLETTQKNSRSHIEQMLGAK